MKLSTMLAIAVAAASNLAQCADSSRLVVRSSGQFDSATTVVYSLYLATREEPLGEILVSSALPAGARFLENLDSPAGARYEGVADNVIQWSVAALDRDTLLGPFTFRVKVDTSRSDVPSAPAFSVSYQSPKSEILVDAGDSTPLKPLADTGAITFDQRGTIDAGGRNGLVAVGGTGILLFIPEGAVDRSVTLTFSRLAVEDDKVPQNVRDTWWCSLYRISSEPGVEFAKPISYVLPARRSVTPGLTVRSFISADGKEWRETTAGTVAPASFKQRQLGFGQFGSGGCQTVPFGFTACTTFGGFGGSQFGGGFGAFGVSQISRAQSAITGDLLSQQFGQPLRAAQIADGTSNIIAILIGLR